MSAREDFWESDLPFISDSADRRVDWTDVGLLSLSAVLTSLYNSIANTVAALFDVAIIDRARDLSAALVGYVEGVFSQGASAVSFSTTVTLAEDIGLIGALAIVLIGAYLLAWAVGVIRSE